MSELAYLLSTQQRALSRDWLFLNPVLDARARQRHQEAAKRYAARLIAGDYFLSCLCGSERGRGDNQALAVF